MYFEDIIERCQNNLERVLESYFIAAGDKLANCFIAADLSYNRGRMYFLPNLPVSPLNIITQVPSGSFISYVRKTNVSLCIPGNKKC